MGRIREFKSKIEEKQAQRRAVKEAEELQRLKTKRIRAEGEAVRHELKQAEVKKIQEARAKMPPKYQTAKKMGKALGKGAASVGAGISREINKPKPRRAKAKRRAAKR